MFFPRDDDHFLRNVEYYRARPEGLASDDDFLYIVGSAAYIVSPRCPIEGQRYVVALWS